MANAPGNIQYNYAQLEGIWCQAGGASGAAPIAAAIAMAESGGNTTATGTNPGSVDRGLWQINSVHGAQSTYDVMGNARAAIAISNNGTNWAPWTTYNNGAYKKFLQTNVAPDTSAPINGTNAAANGANATLTGAFGIPGLPGGLIPTPDIFGSRGFFGKIFDLPQSAANAVDKNIATALQGAILQVLNPFFNMVAGIMGITAGGVMVLVGIFMMVKNTEAGQETGKAAGTAAQAGMSAFAPEVAGSTRYVGQATASGERPVTTVTQRRRAAGEVRIGGRPIRYRQARVQTDVQREGQRSYGDTYAPPGTRDQLVNEANGYNKRRQP